MNRTTGQGPDKLETIDEGSGTNPGISRRNLLLGGAAGLGGLMAANMLSAGPASASAATGYQSVPVRGQSRHVIWANGAIADWNLSYDVGSIEATRVPRVVVQEGRPPSDVILLIAGCPGTQRGDRPQARRHDHT